MGGRNPNTWAITAAFPGTLAGSQDVSWHPCEMWVSLPRGPPHTFCFFVLWGGHFRKPSPLLSWFRSLTPRTALLVSAPLPLWAQAPQEAHTVPHSLWQGSPGSGGEETRASDRAHGVCTAVLATRRHQVCSGPHLHRPVSTWETPPSSQTRRRKPREGHGLCRIRHVCEEWTVHRRLGPAPRVHQQRHPQTATP